MNRRPRPLSGRGKTERDKLYSGLSAGRRFSSRSYNRRAASLGTGHQCRETSRQYRQIDLLKRSLIT